VFFYRKGRRGFAEGAKASRPLRSLCARSPKAAGQALKTRNRAPFAKDAKPLRPLRSLCAPCVTKTPQRGEKTRKFFPHNSRQNRRNNTFQRIHAITQSAIEGKESYVLLDVLKEDVHYSNVIHVPVTSLFVEQSGKPATVKIPDFNNLLGDKLTAFAPNTAGIPYKKGDREMGMEIIKQMYDIGCLCDHADNPAVFASVFASFAETEIGYRDNPCSIADVIDDIIDNALEICLRGNHGKANYDVLLKGINQVKGFIFSESFHLDKAIHYAAKTVYVASLVKYGKTAIERFDMNRLPEIRLWQITAPLNTKLNKIKKSDAEAFFYLYLVSEMMK
jgi:hypothetical protein